MTNEKLCLAGGYKPRTMSICSDAVKTAIGKKASGDQSSSNLSEGKSPRRIASGAGPRALRTKQMSDMDTRPSSRTKLTPFGLDTEKDPDPTSKNLKQFHHKDATFQIVKVVQVWRELETPCTTKHQVHADSTIVHFLGMEIAITAQSPWMLRVVSLSG